MSSIGKYLCTHTHRSQQILRSTISTIKVPDTHSFTCSHVCGTHCQDQCQCQDEHIKQVHAPLQYGTKNYTCPQFLSTALPVPNVARHRFSSSPLPCHAMSGHTGKYGKSINCILWMSFFFNICFSFFFIFFLGSSHKTFDLYK